MPLLFIIPASKSPTQSSLQFTIPKNKAKNPPISADQKIIDNEIVNNYLNNNPEESFFFDTELNAVLPTHHLSIEPELTIVLVSHLPEYRITSFEKHKSLANSTQSIFRALKVARCNEDMPLHENGDWLYTKKTFPYK